VFRFTRLFNSVRKYQNGANIANNEDGTYVGSITSGIPVMGNNTYEQKHSKNDDSSSSDDATAAIWTKMTPVENEGSSPLFIRTYTTSTMKPPPGAMLENGDFVCKPVSNNSEETNEFANKNFSFRCSCEVGILPPGILTKYFGSAQAAFHMGTGKCYHKKS